MDNTTLAIWQLLKRPRPQPDKTTDQIIALATAGQISRCGAQKPERPAWSNSQRDERVLNGCNYQQR